jgi:RNA recognition motif-containing protein
MTTKVFVGNLDFQTTDQALADAFVDCGKVKSGVIITRGRRSLGYGFVEFESAEAADKAVTTKNGTELSKRQIKVELVRDPSERPTRGTKEGQGATDQKQDSEKGQEQQPGRRRNAPRGGRFPGRRRRFATQQQQTRRIGNNNVANTGNNNSSNTGGGKTTGNANNTSNQSSANQSEKNQNQNQNQNPKRRPRRAQRTESNNQPQSPPKEKILSKTAIFVANIPFEAKDEDLKNFFKDSNPKSAHVVTTQTGRSRGYGFVDFDNEKDQQHAIQTKNKAKWNHPEKGDREISVSASHSQPKEEAPQGTQSTQKE